jgi:Asp-tRNA(Asn)/Glu-tRNA(Gln) amidotransferase A subunit family amidase
MALSWSMDKLGPLCRTVEDCALVMAAIHGPDGRDPTVRDAAFAWDGTAGIRGIRVGYVASAFDRDRGEGGAEWRGFDLQALETMRTLTPGLTPVEMPDGDRYPPSAMGFILSVEAAAAFDELTRSNRDDLMVRQVRAAWPNVFRAARLVPAVEYINANRLRTMLMRAMDEALKDVDVVITPSYAPRLLQYTNLTGHPAVVLPNGFRARDGTPTSVSFIGKLFGDAKVLAVAKAWQDATDFHTQHPPRFV